MNSAANPWTEFGQVALNITVCLSALVAPAMARISGSKPKSNIRSASSKIKIVTLSKRTSPSFIKSRKRPGVATITAKPLCFISCFCKYFGPPPYTHTHFIPVASPASSKTFAVCCASSLVGARTRHAGCPGLHGGCALICVKAGNPKAKVLPDPVAAIPTMSWPDMMIGHDCA